MYYYKNENGSALLISLSLIIMLTILGIMVVRSSNTDITLSYNKVHSEQARYLAEAGANRALAEILADKTWNTGFSDVTLGQGNYSVVVVDSLIDPSLDDTIIVTSSGEVMRSRAVIQVELTPLIFVPFRYGLFGDAWIKLDQATCTDSYNSDSGSYAATVVDSMGDVGSNGTVSSAKGVTFGGGISVATPGGISTGPQNTINGDTTSQADSVMLNEVPQYEYDWAEANNHAPLGLSGTNYSYNSLTNVLTVGASGNVNLDGGTYYFSDIIFEQGADLTIDPNESVNLYVTGNIILAQSSTMNDGGQAMDMNIWSQGDSLFFQQDNIFSGTFYGPKAHIQYDQTTQVYGALVGGTIQLDKDACFHYDRSLMNLTRKSVNFVDPIAWKEL